MIVIYERDAADFTNNGLGTLDPVSCIVTETMNGSFEVTLTHPIDEAGKFTRIQEERIIRVPVPAGRTPRMQIAGARDSREIYKVLTGSGARLHLRIGASLQAKIIGAYKVGTEVVIIDRLTDTEWSEVITPDGKRGWMWKEYLDYDRTEMTGEAAEESIREPMQLRDQPFRIYKVEPTLTGITAYARHIFYDLMDNMISSYTPGGSATGAAAFTGLAGATEDEHGFTFYSNLDSTAEEVEITDKNPAEAILDDGGLIENYGGELARDWWDVYLAKRIGEETSIHIREGKNLLGIKYSVDTTNVVTRVIPKGEDEDGNPLYLNGRYRENEAEGRPVYVNNKYGVIEVKEAKVKAKGEDKRTEAECIELMEKAAKEAFEAGCDLPDVTLQVDFIDCAETEEYRQYRFLQGIHMGDTVKVIARRVGVEVAMRMTQYSYDCLTRKYTKMTLGTIDQTIEGNMINPRSIGSGTIKGSMIKLGSIGTGALMDGAVNGLKIALAAIDYAHIGTAAIDQLAANAVTAIRADIRKLVAGNITTDQLYADLAVIAAAQITAANIEKANIQWAEIENLAAEIAKVVNAEIDKATIKYAQIEDLDAEVARIADARIKSAKIDTAQINNLSAAVAVIVKAEIELAEIDWAHIKNVEVGTAQIKLGAITQALIAAGAIGTAQIADGSITSAKIVELTADLIKTGTLSAERLLIKGAGGLFYEINAKAGGLTSTQLTEEQYKNAISGTALVARSVTADKMAAKTITANEIRSNTITAAEINVANLFASSAVIAALDSYIIKTSTIEALKGSLNVWADEKVRIGVGGLQIGGRNLLLNTAELQIKNYAFDASGASAVGSYSADGEGGFRIVCAQQNVRCWLGSVKVTPGQSYAVSVRYKISSGTSPIQFQYVFRDSANVAVAYGGSSATQTTRIEDGWTVLSAVLTIPSNAAIDNVRLAVRTGLDYELYTVDYTVRKPKFETGNKATDWTPAPEDGDAAIAGLSAELLTQAGKITANATKIETVNQAAAGAQGTANNAVTRVKTAEQRISAVEGAITSKVEKADFDALGNKVSANTSAITQTAEAIRSEVASSVSGLQTQIEQTDEQVLILAGRTVGGTNLVRVGEGTVTTLSGVVDRNWEKSAWCQSCTGIVLYTFTSSYNGAHFYTDVKVVPGQYTLSFWCWTYGTNIQPVLRCSLFSSADGVDHYFKDIQTTANTPVRYEIPISVTYSATVNLRMLTWSKWTAGELYISDVKLESGNTATAWSPHPEEFRAGSSVEITENRVKIASRETLIAIPSADGETTVAQFDENGLTASRVSAGNIAYRYDGAAALYVNPNATSAQVAAGNYYRSLADACAAVSGRYLDSSVTIHVQGTTYGDAYLRGVTGYGSVTVAGGNNILYGSLSLLDNTAEIWVNSLKIVRTGTNQVFAGRQYGMGWARWYQCVLDGNGGDQALLSDRGARLMIHKTELYNAARLLQVSHNADASCVSLKGGGGTHFFHGDGGRVTWSGTRPDGTLSIANPCLREPYDLAALTIDYGTAQPSVPAVQTATYNYLYSDSYRSGWQWFSDDDIRQGYDGGVIYGVIWFDAAAIRSALNGKTINQVSLRLYMAKGVGRGVNVNVELYGSNVSYDRTAAPALTTSYGSIGETQPDVVNEITIPAQAVKDMISGTINALVLRSSDSEYHKDRPYSRNYAKFAGSTTATAENCPRLTVVYQ